MNYLHLGANTDVLDENIIGIFDIENTSVSKITKDFLAGKNFKVINVSFDIPKSFILTESENETVLYISQIAPATLKKRNNENTKTEK